MLSLTMYTETAIWRFTLPGVVLANAIRGGENLGSSAG